MNIYFSIEAENQLDEIADYLGSHWSQKIKTDFLAVLATKLELITQMPAMYRSSVKRPGLRECIINKHTILYYRVAARYRSRGHSVKSSRTRQVMDYHLRRHQQAHRAGL